jgi:hypothetical protein
MSTDFWFLGFRMVCEVNFSTTFWEPLWVPKRRRNIHLAHRAKPQKPEIKSFDTFSKIYEIFER